MKKNRKPKRKFFRDQRGQGMTEYILIVGLVAVGTIAAITTFGDTLRIHIAKSIAAIQGETYNGTDFKSIGSIKDASKARDLSDYSD